MLCNDQDQDHVQYILAMTSQYTFGIYVCHTCFTDHLYTANNATYMNYKCKSTS